MEGGGKFIKKLYRGLFPIKLFLWGNTLTCFNVLCCFYLLLLCKIVENMSNSITVVFKEDISIK